MVRYAGVKASSRAGRVPEIAWSDGLTNVRSVVQPPPFAKWVTIAGALLWLDMSATGNVDMRNSDRSLT